MTKTGPVAADPYRYSFFSENYNKLESANPRACTKSSIDAFRQSLLHIPGQ